MPLQATARARRRAAGHVPSDRAPGRPPQPERLEIVVREHLGVVLRSAERLDPSRRPLVPLAPAAPRNLTVRDVAYEQVAEGVLILAANRGAPLPAHEFLPLERVE